jgi:hypothetical protein
MEQRSEAGSEFFNPSNLAPFYEILKKLLNSIEFGVINSFQTDNCPNGEVTVKKLV